LSNFAIRYIATLGTTLFVFTNFIACGAQMYQVSLEDDFAHERTSAASKDPAAPEFGIHAIAGWDRLPIKFRTGDRLSPVQKAGLVKAMKTWESAIGKPIFEFIGKDQREGDSFSDLYSSLNDRVNGHYMDDDWQKTGKPNAVLATTIWDNVDPNTISTADIRFNSNHYMIQDSLDEDGIQLTSVESGKEVVDMQSLALHELGHLLGLAHVPAEQDAYSIMNPSLYIGAGLASRKISRGDIIRIQRIYGCEDQACNVEQLFSMLEKNMDLEKFQKDQNSGNTANIPSKNTYENTYSSTDSSDKGYDNNASDNNGN